MVNSSITNKNLQALSPLEMLAQPVTSLVGVTTEAAKALGKIGIKTIQDLATSSTFTVAARIAEASYPVIRPGQSRQIPVLPSDIVKKEVIDVPIEQLANEPISIFSTISKEHASYIESALGVHTVRDLALLSSFLDASDILAKATGTVSSDVVEDPEAPPYLVPEMGTHPTERIHYDVILLDRILGSPNNGLISIGQVTNGFNTSRQTTNCLIPIEQITSPISISITDEPFSRPAIGAVIRFTQSWYTSSLAYGHLLHSLALAPGETTRVAVIDWSRQEQAVLQGETSQTEALYGTIGRNRAISEVTDAVAREAQSGFSNFHGEEQSYSVGGGSGAAFSMGKVGEGTAGYSLGGSGGKTDAFSTSFTSGQREVKGNMVQDICDITQQAANSVRNRRASVVREVTQKESETLSTRAITNFNHMHALTIQYYEVVQLYRTVVEISEEPIRCLFLPLKPLDFSDENLVRRFRMILAAAALTKELQDNLNALDASVNVSGGQYDDSKWLDEARNVTGLALKNSTPELWLLPPSTQICGWKVSVIQGVLLNNAISYELSDIISSINVKKDSGTETGNIFAGAGPYSPVNTTGWSAGGQTCTAEFDAELLSSYHSIEFTPTKVDVARAVENAFIAAQGAKASASRAITTINELVTSAQNAQVAAAKFLEDATKFSEAATLAVPPGLAAEMPFAPDPRLKNITPKNLAISAKAIANNAKSVKDAADKIAKVSQSAKDSTATADYDSAKESAAIASSVAKDPVFDAPFLTVPVTLLANSLGMLPKNIITEILSKVVGAPYPDDLARDATDVYNKILDAKSKADATVTAAQDAATKAPATQTPGADGNIPPVMLQVEFDLKYKGRTFTFKHNVPIVTDGKTFDAVTINFENSSADEQLQEQSLYYSQVIWRSLGPSLFAQFDGYSYGGHQLTELIDPAPVAVIGNYVAFPFYPKGEEEDKNWNSFLEDHKLDEEYRKEKRKVDIVPLPSEGVFAEAVLGRFNSAEKLDITRFWNWQDSPIPITAPEIASLQAKIPTSNQPNITFSELDSPLINMSNPPALPDPSGLSAALTAVANSSMFRDMSNAAQTIQAAKDVLLAGFTASSMSQETATRYSEQAANVFGSTISNLGGKFNEAGKLDRESPKSGGDNKGSNSSISGINSNSSSGTISSGESSNMMSDTGSSRRDQVLGTGPLQMLTDMAYGAVNSNDISQIDNAEIEWARQHPEGHVEPGVFEGRVYQDILSLWNFDVGSADITKFEAGLWDNLRMLKEWANLGDTLIITGHASSSGSEETNSTLSRKRALNVKDWLVNKGGIDETSINIVPLGTSFQIPDSRIFDPEARARERRVEIRRNRRSWTQNDYDRALNIVQNMPNSERKKRLLGVIPILKKESGDDRYIDKAGLGTAYSFYSKPGFEWLDDVGQWDKNSPRIIFSARDNWVSKIHPGYSDDEVLSILLSTDTRIWEAIQWIAEQEARHEEGGLSILVGKAKKWISLQQSNANSIYFFYK